MEKDFRHIDDNELMGFFKNKEGSKNMLILFDDL
jgi:hypothetical protein